MAGQGDIFGLAYLLMNKYMPNESSGLFFSFSFGSRIALNHIATNTAGKHKITFLFLFYFCKWFTV